MHAIQLPPCPELRVQRLQLIDEHRPPKPIGQPSLRPISSQPVESIPDSAILQLLYKKDIERKHVVVKPQRFFSVV